MSEKLPAVHSKKENTFLLNAVNLLLSQWHERGGKMVSREGLVCVSAIIINYVGRSSSKVS